MGASLPKNGAVPSLGESAARLAGAVCLIVGCASLLLAWLGGGLAVLVLGALVVLLVVLGLRLFRRRIVVALRVIETITARMAGGRLDELVDLGPRRDEIGRIGEQVNDMAINLQEIFHHLWNHGRDDLALLDAMERKLAAGEAGNVGEELRLLRLDVEEIRSLVTAHAYYQVDVEDEKLVVGGDKGR